MSCIICNVPLSDKDGHICGQCQEEMAAERLAVWNEEFNPEKA